MDINIPRAFKGTGWLSKLAVFPQAAQASLEVLRGERQELPQFANSLALILGRMAASGLGFLTWLVLARLYAPTEVGLASGLISATMLLVQLSLLGIGSAFITRYPHYRENSTRLLDTALGLVSGAALLGAGIFILLSARFFTELSIVAEQPAFALLFFLMALFGGLNSLMDSFSIAFRRSDQVLLRNILFGVITIGAGVIFSLLTARDSIYIISGWVLAGLGATILGGMQLWKTLSRYLFRWHLDWGIAGELITTGLPNYLLTLSERAPNWVLPILVTELISPADNARWYAVWMTAWVVYQIPISVGQNLFADVSRYPERLKSLVAHSHRTSLVVGGLVGTLMLIFAPLFLSLLGRDYALQGTLPLRILSLAVYPGIFIQAYYAVCRGTSRLREATVTGLVIGLAGTAAAAAAGLSYGLAGMAAAWLVIQAIAGVWAVWRTHHLGSEVPAPVM
jgi:O-antigen/teichoic acid export membrane protein